MFHNAIFCITAFCIATTGFAEEEAPALEFEKDVLPLVDKYCMDCHEGDKPKGALDLVRFETREMVLDSFAIWQRMAMRIENKEMPPRKEENLPTDEERQTMVTWIKGLKFDEGDCDRLASEETTNWYPGYVMSRRLNRHEYENTMRDLLGNDLELSEMFPADGAGGEGFDTNGSTLFLSAIQIEKYLNAADLAVESALPEIEFAKHSYPSKFRSRKVETISNKDEINWMARELLITNTPKNSRKHIESATQVIRDFTERAWRRSVTDEELSKLVGVYEKVYARGDGYDASLKLAFKAALISPHFLFLAEPEPESYGEYPLGDFQLASRLSYFLWGTMPDDELNALAEKGVLQDDDVLRAQVTRMLQHPKARALGELFAMQWLGITQLGETTKPDANKFPEFGDGMADVMREEAIQFFGHVIQEDRSFLDLIDSDYTFVNDELAALYGMDGIEGDAMRRVELEDANRGGVVGMAAMLTTTSQPLRTSPVLRGKWVLEQLLGDRVPPPPPNVPELVEEEDHPEGLTMRQQLEVHRKNPECATCHNRMDPIGFGLENFDPIGRWRSEQFGEAIDTEGVLPSGESFNGPVELKAILMKRKDSFANNLTRKMLGYALGRRLTQYDQCVVDDAMKALQANDYKPSALLSEIVLSYPFRNRYSGNKVTKGD
jgi:hypothetical protein